MILMSIQNLEIFDVCPNRYGVAASICADGIYIYGVQILSGRSAFSGQNTFGVFESTDKHSLIAWIDPVSGEFLSLRPHWLNSPAGIVVLTILLAGLVSSATNLFLLYLGLTISTYFAIFPSSALMVFCTALIIGCIKFKKKISPLEIQLRRKLKNTNLME